jgi:hypothetical protein
MSIAKMVTVLTVALVVLGLLQGVATAFVHPSCTVPTQKRSQSLALLQASSKGDDPPPPPIGGTSSRSSSSTTTTSPPKPGKQDDRDAFLGEKTFGGYTVKQRLREEVESPFRKVRFALFAGSTGSALVACYFSALNTIKALAGGYADAMPLEEALTSDAINVGALVLCGYLAYREYQTGEANLARISRGGKLASLVVEPAASVSALDQVTKGTTKRRRLVEYRRNSRVLIAAGGKEYISKLALSLTSDQLSDSNTIAERLVATDVIVVPVLLVSDGRNGKVVVGDTRECWNNQVEAGPTDRNFDIDRANSVLAFPRGNPQWTEYLESDINTAKGQGFDVLTKGITLTVKKNGRILRRSTGLPPWPELIGTMEVLDGSRFGMPGDTEKYGGD